MRVASAPPLPRTAQARSPAFAFFAFPSAPPRALLRRWNHSESPCTGLPPAGEGYCFESSYAIRDIKAGEELLDDYGLYEYPPWYDALCAEFGVDRSFVDRKAAPAKETWKGYEAGGVAAAAK